MPPVIVATGYEDTVRNRLGVTSGELPDSVINDRMVIDMAEAAIMRRVPRYNDITDVFDRLLLESAVINYVCYLLAPSMARRLEVEVTTIDTRWKKERVNWDAVAQKFLSDVESDLSGITTVEVVGLTDVPLGGIANWTNAEDRSRDRGI